jgi:hypothetical protein
MLPFEAKMQLGVLRSNLANSDKVLIRFLEDLMVLFVQKGIITTAEIPKIIVDKVVQRKQWRLEMAELREKFKLY